MKFASFLAALALAAAGPVSVAVAQTATPSGPPTIAELTADDRIHGVEVSPSGRYLAIIRHADMRDFIQIIDLEKRSQSTLAVNTPVSMAITDVRWKSDDRLLYAYRQQWTIARPRGKPPLTFLGAWGLTATNRDGSDVVYIPGIGLVDWLNDDPRQVIVVGVKDKAIGSARTAVAVDIASGARTELDSGTRFTLTWDTDRKGQLVLRYDLIGRRGGVRVLKRGDAADWVELFAIRRKELETLPDMEVVGVSEDPSKIYVAVKPEDGGAGDTRELRLYDLVGRSMGPPLLSAPGYDFEEVSLDEKTGEITGLCYWKDVYHCDLSDPEERKDYEAMVARFGPDRSVYMHSASDDRNIRVVYIRGPADAGSFHVYDRRTGKVEALGNQRPTLKGDRLAPTTRFEWKARDGLALSGYVTTPRGAGPNAPLVVMPHGGPEARDRLDYDRWAQAFAARGYVVFQPNFRGSGGFGRRFAERGYGQWGLAMQDDVMDGLDALIATGKVDASRVCVVGASYGGYVSLYAGARHPDRFRCIVSFAGVSDLVASQVWEARESGADSPRYRYWLKSVGDPVADAERLIATSPITYAKDYGPPVLLIHGVQDDIVPVSQSRAMEKALKRAGRWVRLIEVKDEGHSGWATENEADALTEMIDFVDTALGAPK